MDRVADAAQLPPEERPSFYISEESQQYKFRCEACDEFNDILGRFGYCSSCGTRNDLKQFTDSAIEGIRRRINDSAPLRDCVRDAVAAFDSFVAQYAKQLAEHVPMSERRILRLTKNAFHDLDEVRQTLQDWFDIDLTAGMKDAEVSQVRLMFLRRHVYEHNGGEVDQRYLDKSGDTSVRLKQALNETKEGAHGLLGSLLKMARNLHIGFHKLMPPEKEPLEAFRRQQERIAKRGQG